MALQKLKLNSYLDTGMIRSCENEMLLLEHQAMLFMITRVRFFKETETYGRKDNKTREVRYMECELLTWNSDGHFISTFDEFNTRRLLERNLMVMRRNYIDFEKGWKALHEWQDKLTTPDIVKPIPE